MFVLVWFTLGAGNGAETSECMLETRQYAYLQAMGVSCWEARQQPITKARVFDNRLENKWLVGLCQPMTKLTERLLLDVVALMNPDVHDLHAKLACIQPIDQLPAGHGQQLIFAEKPHMNESGAVHYYLGELEAYIDSPEAKNRLWCSLQTLFGNTK